MIDRSNYKEHADKYFLRSKKILEGEGINPIVRYQVFARQDIPSLKGIEEAVSFIREVTGDKIKIYSLSDGNSYSSGEPMMKLEGRVQDLIDLETGYLGIISGALTGPIDLEEVRSVCRSPRHDLFLKHFINFLFKVICFLRNFLSYSFVNLFW